MAQKLAPLLPHLKIALTYEKIPRFSISHGMLYRNMEAGTSRDGPLDGIWMAFNGAPHTHLSFPRNVLLLG